MHMLVLVSGMPLVYSGAECRVLQHRLQATNVSIVCAIDGHNHSLSQYVQCCLLIPPLISLQDSTVRQTPCPLPTGAAVGNDAGAVDPPTQGTVRDWTCVLRLGWHWVHEVGGPLGPQLVHTNEYRECTTTDVHTVQLCISNFRLTYGIDCL